MFILRPWEFTDGPSLVRAADNPHVAQYLADFFPQPYTEEDAASYIALCRNTPEEMQYNRAVVVDGQACGSISLFFGHDVERDSAEIGYWLAEDKWGQGIMTEAIASMCRTAFDDRHVHRVYARVFDGNTASMRVLEKNGFTKEAVLKEAVKKQDRYLDLWIFRLLEEEFRRVLP